MAKITTERPELAPALAATLAPLAWVELVGAGRRARLHARTCCPARGRAQGRPRHDERDVRAAVRRRPVVAARRDRARSAADVLGALSRLGRRRRSPSTRAARRIACRLLRLDRGLRDDRGRARAHRRAHRRARRVPPRDVPVHEQRRASASSRSAGSAQPSVDAQPRDKTGHAHPVRGRELEAQQDDRGGARAGHRAQEPARRGQRCRGRRRAAVHRDPRRSRSGSRAARS